MTVIDSLITDRTFDDARFHTDKGLYRASDLNRVEEAVRYLAGELAGAGYRTEIDEIVKNHAVPIVSTDGSGTPVLDGNGELTVIDYRRWSDTTWIEEDIPNFEQMEIYLRNLERLREALPVFPTTPQVPQDMDMLTYSEANNIEKILSDVHRALENTKAAWMYSGEIYAGEV